MANYIFVRMSDRPPDEFELTAFYVDEPPGMRIAPAPRGGGFHLLNECRWVAKWTGGADPGSLTVRYEGERPSARALSDKGNGIVTLVIPYLFRTPPGFDLLVRGPFNQPRDGIAPLEALIEADCAASPFTMDWQFTRPGTVAFEEGEPVCMVVPQSRREAGRFRSEVRPVDDEIEREWRAASRRRHGAAVREYLRSR
jgi:hypothetical protein